MLLPSVSELEKLPPLLLLLLAEVELRYRSVSSSVPASAAAIVASCTAEEAAAPAEPAVASPLGMGLPALMAGGNGSSELPFYLKLCSLRKMPRADLAGLEGICTDGWGASKHGGLCQKLIASFNPRQVVVLTA